MYGAVEAGMREGCDHAETSSILRGARWSSSRRSNKFLAASLAVVSVMAVLTFVDMAGQRRSALMGLYYIGWPNQWAWADIPRSELRAPVWNGAGAGGDTGARYHWAATSFTPIRQRSIEIAFTHDHSSMANWWNDTAFSLGEPGPYWVKGSHVGYNSTSSFGDLGWVKNPFKGLVPNPYTMPPMNQTLPAMEEPLQFWGKIFPVYKGYSSNLFGNSSAPDPSAEEEEEAAQEEEASASSEEANPEAEAENMPPERVFGGDNPMIFGDLNPVGGFAHIPLQFKPARWYRRGYSSFRKY